MRSDRERLLDIVEAIANSERRIGANREAFFQDELLQTWAVHHLQIIGEAAARLSRELRDRSPQIPWPDVIDQRNVLVHHYFGIDLHEVWDSIARDLPVLKQQIQALLPASGQAG
jgi:uncharacterized protein with HEPN domain